MAGLGRLYQRDTAAAWFHASPLIIAAATAAGDSRPLARHAGGELAAGVAAPVIANVPLDCPRRGNYFGQLARLCSCKHPRADGIEEYSGAKQTPKWLRARGSISWVDREARSGPPEKPLLGLPGRPCRRRGAEALHRSLSFLGRFAVRAGDSRARMARGVPIRSVAGGWIQSRFGFLEGICGRVFVWAGLAWFAAVLHRVILRFVHTRACGVSSTLRPKRLLSLTVSGDILAITQRSRVLDDPL